MTGVFVAFIVAAVGVAEDCVGAGAIFLFVHCRGVVHLGTAGNLDALGNVVGQTAAQGETVLVVDELVAVDNPIWVLHTDTHVAPWPILNLEAACLAVHLELLISVEAVAWREQVG